MSERASINQQQALFSRWYEEYRERRYLAKAPESEILQRGKDLIGNALTLTAEGKIGLRAVDTPHGSFVMRLLSHFLEESRLRTGDPRGLLMRSGMNQARVPSATAPNAPASADIIRLVGELRESRRLYKFGNHRRLTRMLGEGEVLVKPASSYNDPSLAKAVADDELSYELATAPFNVDIVSLHPFKERLSDVFGAPRTAPQRISMATDYYVWCASFGLGLRMFDDFNYDSVLVVEDTVEFSRRLLNEVRKLLPGWTFVPCAVHYFDPYHPSAKTRSVFACKHFSYLYQEEFRFVFLPPKPVARLESMPLKIKPLGDIAKLYKRW